MLLKDAPCNATANIIDGTQNVSNYKPYERYENIKILTNVSFDCLETMDSLEISYVWNLTRIDLDTFLELGSYELTKILMC